MRETQTVTINASGRGVIEVSPPRLQHWNVTQVTTKHDDAPIGANCEIVINDGDIVTRMVASGDVADQAPPVELFSSDIMKIIWTDSTPNTIAKATYYYDLIT